MVDQSKLQNRIIPYKMLKQAVSTTYDLVDKILPEDGMPALRIGLKYIDLVMADFIKKAGEGQPVILINSWGHPFHTCSSQKGTMGMTLDDLFKFDAIITPTAPCDNTYASYPFFRYHKNIPLVTPDLPSLLIMQNN